MIVSPLVKVKKKRQIENQKLVVICYFISKSIFILNNLQHLHSNLFRQFFNQRIKSDFPEFAFRAAAEGDGAVFFFFCADDAQVRHEVEAAVADFCVPELQFTSGQLAFHIFIESVG